MSFLVTAILTRVNKLPIIDDVAITQRTAALIDALAVSLGASSSDELLPESSFNELNAMVKLRVSNILLDPSFKKTEYTMITLALSRRFSSKV